MKDKTRVLGTAFQHMLDRWRRAFRTALPLLFALLSAIAVLAPAKASAETRSLKLYYLHTGERDTITFKRNGKYIDSGLKKINRFLRDWRRNEPTKMDPRLLDLVWEIYKEAGSRDYIHVISGYRSPATNGMLKRRGRGVARNSQHTKGRALDFFLPDVKLSKLHRIAMRKQLGGVGYYTRGTRFIHVDTARVRHWPRMSRSQLAKIFPNGRTLHVPTDGKPFKGYNLAKADYERKIKGQGKIVIAKAEDIEKRPGFFKRLLGGRDDEGEDAIAATAPRPVKTVPAPKPAEAIPSPQPAEPVPIPEPEELLLADVPVPTLAPRGAGTQVAALAPDTDAPIDPDQTPEDQLAFAIPVPSQRPEFEPDTVLAANEPQPETDEPAIVVEDVPEEAPAAPIRVAALTPTEIEDLRRQVNSTLASATTSGDGIGNAGSALASDRSVTESEPANPDPVIAAIETAGAPDDEAPDTAQEAISNQLATAALLPDGSTEEQQEETAREPGLIVALAPIEPGTGASGVIATPAPAPLRSLEPLEPGAVTSGDIAVPAQTPERVLEPLEPGLVNTGEPALPSQNPQREEPVIEPEIQIASVPVPQPSPKAASEPGAVQVASAAPSVGALPKSSLEAFSLPDLNRNIVGRWALANDRSIAAIAEIRPPAYGRNAIRETPSEVLTRGFTQTALEQKTGIFTGSSVEFLAFAKFERN